jgi:hypothetical protein
MKDIENDASNISSVVASVFVAAVTFLRSRCLVTIGGIHRHRDAMIYIRSFIKTDSGIQMLIGGIHIHTDSMKIP